MQIYPNLHVATLDVTNQQQVDAMVASIVEEDGKIDVLINNAGYGLPGVLEMVHIDDAKSMFDVNVWGVVR